MKIFSSCQGSRETTRTRTREAAFHQGPPGTRTRDHQEKNIFIFCFTSADAGHKVFVGFYTKGVEMIKKSVETVYREIRETIAGGGTVFFSTVIKTFKPIRDCSRIRLTSEGRILFQVGKKWFPAGSGMIHEGTDYFVPMVDIRVFRPNPASLTELSK